MEILDAKKKNTWEGGASFSLANRVYRVFWKIIWLSLASWTPPAFKGWRRFLLNSFGASVAKTAVVYSSAKIWSPRNLVLDEFACLGRGCVVYNMAPTTIGAYSVISQGAHLCGGTHDIEDRGFQLKARSIRIGARVWIAAEAFVGPGVSIGDGAVLGARACAMKDLEAWTVYTGNPATSFKLRKIRF